MSGLTILRPRGRSKRERTLEGKGHQTGLSGAGNSSPGLGWTFRISSGVSEGIYNSVVQSDWEFLRIEAGRRQ